MTPYYDKAGVTLYCGDALTVLPQLDVVADTVATDPPYSSGGMVRGDRATRTTDEKYTVSGHEGRRPDFFGDNMDQRAWLHWSREWTRAALALTRPGAYLICFIDWRQLPALTDAIQWGGWVWRGILAWDKTEAAKGPHPGYFAYQCEFPVWATHGPCLPKPTLSQGGQGRMPGCWRKAVQQSDKLHQTGKPTEVMHWLLMCCPPDGLVLDPFFGSGTTAKACLETGRRFVGCELREEYCELTARRLDATTPGLFAAKRSEKPAPAAGLFDQLTGEAATN